MADSSGSDESFWTMDQSKDVSSIFDQSTDVHQEDAAVKTNELKIMWLKSKLEELQNQFEIVKKRTSDQQIVISNLQSRLDEQEIRMQNMEKQMVLGAAPEIAETEEEENEDTEYKFNCPQCDKKYKMKHHLGRHMKTHSKPEQHLCQFCAKNFTRKEDAKRHEKICKKK